LIGDHRGLALLEIVVFSVATAQHLGNTRRGQQGVVGCERRLLACIGLFAGGHRQIAEVGRQTFDIVDVETEVIEIDLGSEVAAPARQPRLLHRRLGAAIRGFHCRRLHGRSVGGPRLYRRGFHRGRIPGEPHRRAIDARPLATTSRPFDRRRLLRHRQMVCIEIRSRSPIGVFVVRFLRHEQRGLETGRRPFTDVERVIARIERCCSLWLRRKTRRRQFARGCQIEVESARDIVAGRGDLIEGKVERRVTRLQVNVDAARSGRRFGKQAFVRADLPAHDDDLVPVGVAVLSDLFVQALRGLEKGVLIAPNEEHFEQLELQVAAIRRCVERFLDQLGGLIVETVGHVEVGFGNGIGLVEVDDGLTRQRLVGRGRRRTFGLRHARGCSATRRLLRLRLSAARAFGLLLLDDNRFLGRLATHSGRRLTNLFLGDFGLERFPAARDVRGLFLAPAAHVPQCSQQQRCDAEPDP
jgi:hypothetical protein